MYTHHYDIILLVQDSRRVCSCVPSVALYVVEFAFNCDLRRRSDVLKRDWGYSCSFIRCPGTRDRKVQITELDPVVALEVYEISNRGRKPPP